MINIIHMLVTVSECNSINVDSDPTSREHDANETRQTASDTMDQAIGTARKLTEYTGELKNEDKWHYTTGDKPLKLYAPKEEEDMTISQAIRHCSHYTPSTPGSRLWDGDTTIAANMPNLTVDHKYWITSVGRTASDAIRHCATLSIQQAGKPRSIEIYQHKDCLNDTVKALPMCIRDPDNLSARQKGTGPCKM